MRPGIQTTGKIQQDSTVVFNYSITEAEGGQVLGSSYLRDMVATSFLKLCFVVD
jgi:hypothetical protein